MRIWRNGLSEKRKIQFRGQNEKSVEIDLDIRVVECECGCGVVLFNHCGKACAAGFRAGKGGFVILIPFFFAGVGFLAGSVLVILACRIRECRKEIEQIKKGKL